MRFDAYAGNVAGASAEEVATYVAWANTARVERGRPRGRHHDCFEVKDGNDSLGWVGHDAHLDTAFFEFKGGTTPACAGAIRKHFPQSHTVSRLDSCEDFNEAGSYGRLVGLVDQCTDPRVKSREIRPRTGDDGITTYWGSTTSRVMVRCYEAGKMKERRHLGRPDWVRVEAQVRPGKALEKRAAAFVSPVEAWGWAAWTKRLAEVLARVEVPRFAAHHEPPEFDRTTGYLARAFRRHFEELLVERGDWVCIGREFEAIWQRDDEARSQAKADAEDR
jgi:hypothetical protein